MSFKLSPRKSFAENIARLAERRLSKALGRLAGLFPDEQTRRPEDVPPDVVASIHRARKDLKRTRALLRLARHGMDPAAFARENAAVRDAGRALSSTRDAQVLLEVFDRLDPGAQPGAPGQLAPESPGRIRQWLCDRARATEHPDRLLPSARQAIGILEGVRSRIPAWNLQKGGWRLLAGGLRTTYRNGRCQLLAVANDAGNLAGAGDALAWHEWRKHVRYLACHVHLLRPLWPRVIKQLAKELDTLGDLLGDDHDLAVLHDQVGGGAILEDPAELAVFSGLVTTRRAVIQQRAFAIGHRVYQEKPGAFIRRFGGYWKAWRREHPAKVRPAAAAPDR